MAERQGSSSVVEKTTCVGGGGEPGSRLRNARQVERASALLDFVKRAFGATETLRTIDSAGGMHAEVRIGDSMLMMGGFEGMPFPSMPTALHMYVEDADAVYARALEAGADPSTDRWISRTGTGKPA